MLCAALGHTCIWQSGVRRSHLPRGGDDPVRLPHAAQDHDGEGHVAEPIDVLDDQSACRYDTQLLKAPRSGALDCDEIGKAIQKRTEGG